MPKKRYTPEEIVAKLRQVDVLVSQGQNIADAIRQIGVSEVTYLSRSIRKCSPDLRLCLGEYRTRSIVQARMWQQKHTCAIRSGRWNGSKIFGGRGVLRWAGAWIVGAFEPYSTTKANV